MKRLFLGVYLLLAFSVFDTQAQLSPAQEIDNLRAEARKTLKEDARKLLFVSILYEKIHQKINALPAGAYPIDSSYAFYKEALKNLDYNLSLIKTKKEQSVYLKVEQPLLEGAIQQSYYKYQATGEIYYLEKAFEIVERQHLPFNQIPNILPVEVSGNLRYAEGQILALRDSIHQHPEASKTRRMLNLKKEFSKLKDSIGLAYPAYASFLELHEFARLTEVQEVVKPKELVVEYFRGKQNLYAFVTSKDSSALVLIPLSDVAMLDHSIQTYLQGLKEPGRYQEFVASAHQLYTLLIEPLQAHLSGVEEITIIPDPSLVAILISIGSKKNCKRQLIKELVQLLLISKNIWRMIFCI